MIPFFISPTSVILIVIPLRRSRLYYYFHYKKIK